MHWTQAWLASTCLNGGIFWFTVRYKECCLWRFRGTDCLRLQVDWMYLRRMLRKLVERNGLLQFWPSKAVIVQRFPKRCYILCSSLPFTLPTKTIVSQPEDGSSTSFRKLGQSLARQFETPINKRLTYTKLRPRKPEKLYKWPYHWTYWMSYCGRQMALIVWSGVAKQ